MQMFGTDGSEDKPKVVVGNQEIKVMKASKIPEGNHLVRFWPLSSQFHEGADYPAIVQHVHWLNRRPCVCRAKSYDWTVPEVEPKGHPDTACPICNDKFVWFKKGKELKETNPVEGEKLRRIGIDLMEKISASSIVSFYDNSGNLTAPVVLRYGKELLERLQLEASMVMDQTGVHICDPAKGYKFLIIVGKNEGGFRTYKNSMRAVDASAVDITQAPWDWKEVAQAINPEIMPILTAEGVMDFYTANYGKQKDAGQEFANPHFNSAQNGEAVNNQAATQQQSGTFTPPSNPPATEEVATFTPPAKEAEVVQETTQVQAQTQTAPLPPCHGSNPNTDGYDANDAACKACPVNSAKSCYSATIQRTSKPATAPAATAPAVANTQEGSAAPSFTKDSVEGKLGELNNRIGNGNQ